MPDGGAEAALRSERRGAAEHLVGEGAERVDVARGRRLLTAELLGRNRVRVGDEPRQLPVGRLRQDGAAREQVGTDPEQPHPGSPVRVAVQQHPVEPQGPVDELALVQGRQRLQQPLEDRSGFVHVHRPGARETGSEGLSVHVVLGDEHAVPGGGHHHPLRQARVLRAGEQALGDEETVPTASVSGELGVHHQQPHLGALGSGEVSRADAIGVEPAHHDVGADRVAAAQIGLRLPPTAEEADELARGLAAARRDGVHERRDRVLLDRVTGEGLGERGDGSGAADRLRIEGEERAAQVEELIEVEEAFELGAQEVDHGFSSEVRAPRGAAARE